MSDMRLHEKLQHLCGKRRWNQSSLLRAMGANVSKSAMSDWYNGKFRPDLSSALRMARALGVSLDYLADDALDEPAVVEPASTSDLSEDERAVLALYRALRLGEAEALRRLAGRIGDHRAVPLDPLPPSGSGKREMR